MTIRRYSSHGLLCVLLVWATVCAGCTASDGSASVSSTLVAQASYHYVLAGRVSMKKPPTLFDVSAYDTKDDDYLLSDISNGAIDVVNSSIGRLLHTFTGFNLPSGIVVIRQLATAWVGQGDSEVKVLSLRTGRVLHTISTGGKLRADELAYDPSARVVAVVNDLDSPPFVTLISEKTNKVIAQLSYPEANSGLDAPTWDAATSRFYVGVPSTMSNPGGALAVVAPNGRRLGLIELSGCMPAGVDALADGDLFIACASSIQIVSPLTHKVLTDDPTGATASDEAVLDAPLQLGFVATSRGIVVVDTTTGRLQQVISAPAGSHSVAVNPTNGKLFVPESGKPPALFVRKAA